MHDTTDQKHSSTLNPVHPQEIIQQFTATMWRVVEELMFLEECRKKRRPGQPVYTTPSTTYLATKCGCTRWTISRATEALVELGVLHKQFRRKVGNQFQTCLYRVSNKFRWRINRVGAAIKSVTSRVRQTAHKQDKPIKVARSEVAPAPKRSAPPPLWGALRDKLRR